MATEDGLSLGSTGGWLRRAAGVTMPGMRVPDAWQVLAGLYGFDIAPGGLTRPTAMRGAIDGYRVTLTLDASERTETKIEVGVRYLPTGLMINQCRAPWLARWRAVDLDDAAWSDSFSVFAYNHDDARRYLTPARRRNLESLADPPSVRFSRRWTVRNDSVSYSLKGAKHNTTKLAEFIQRLLDIARALDPTT